MKSPKGFFYPGETSSPRSPPDTLGKSQGLQEPEKHGDQLGNHVRELQEQARFSRGITISENQGVISKQLRHQPAEQEVVETLDPEVDKAIREYGMAVGDPGEEERLRESAKKSRILRHSLVHPGAGLTSSSPDFSIFRRRSIATPEGHEDTPHP